MGLAEGALEEQTLRQGGFNDAEIGQWKAETTGTLRGAGYAPSEVEDYFGAPTGTPTDLRPHVKAGLDEHVASLTPEGGGPKKATTFADAFWAGIQGSSGGLMARKALPNIELPMDAELGMKIMAASGQMAGDIPAMIAGGIVGGAAGSEAPLVGNVLGASAGAFALPAMIRKSYMEDLQKGAIKDFPDFFSRLAATAYDGMKGAVTGVATAGVGGAIANPIAKMGAELATMTTIGKGMEGEAPKAEDFIVGAVTLAGLHGALHVAGEMPGYAKDIQTKLQNTYAETGLKPQDVLERAVSDIPLRQELLAQGTETPNSLAKDPDFPQSKMLEIEPGEHNPVLNSEFDDSPPLRIPAPEPETVLPELKPPAEGEPPHSDRDIILSRIGEQGKAKPEKWDNWYTRTVDRLNPVFQWVKEAAGGKKISTPEDPYAIISTATSRGFARANEAIETGPVDFHTEKPTGAKGFRQIVEPFKDDPQGFKAYLIAKRNIELSNRDIETGIPVEVSRRLVEEGGAKYDDAAKELYEFKNAGIKYLKDSGFFSNDQYKYILEQNQEHVPFRRVLDEGPSKGKGQGAPLKNIKGSERKIIDPFESILKDQFTYYKLAEENAGKQSIIDFARKYDVSKDLIETVPQKSKPIKASDIEVEKWLRENGMLSEGGGETTDFTLWRPMALPLAEGEFAVMENGERRVYQVDPSLAKALKATDYRNPNLLTKVAGVFAKIQRIGVTENPVFLALHGIRDQQSAFVQSQNGYRLGYEGMRGMFHLLFKTEDANEFFRQGGGMSTLADFDEKYIKDDVWGLSKKTGLLDKALNVVKTPFQMMHALANLVFTAPKMGEYMRARDAGKDPFTAMYEGRRVTADVQQRGSSPLIQAWSAATPFMSMRIRGMDRMVEAFRTDPVGTGVKMALTFTLPSIATWWAFKDDPRYKNAPDWQKDLYWIIPLGTPEDGATLRIPKAFEPALIWGSAFERSLQKFYDQKPEAFKHFGEALVGDSLPNVIPPVIMPLLEQYANRSWLTGGQVVPSALEKVSPEFHTNAYTTETAITLGKVIGSIPVVGNLGPGNITPASPMVVENYVRAWGGTLGNFALHVIDKSLEAAHINPSKVVPEAKEWYRNLAEIPFLKSFFMRYPSGGVQPLINFYDNYKLSETHYANVKKLKDDGNVAGLDAYSRSPQFEEHAVMLRNMEKGLSNQSNLIKKIYADPSIPADAKRQQIDTIYYRMIQAAEYGNEIMYRAAKAMKKRD